MQRTYTIVGMTCNGCKNVVEKKINNLNNVIKATVSLESSEATIEMSKLIPLEHLQEHIGGKYSISKNTISKEVELQVDKKSDLKQLFPLFLILFYITVASFLLNTNPWGGISNFMLDFMGLFYIVFSFFKLLDLKGFSKSFTMYDSLANKTPFYAWVYPFIEVFLGFMFLNRMQISVSLIITLVILTITTFGVVKTLLNKKTIQCACLGTVLKLPMTKATVIENSIMIIMAIIMLVKITVT